MAWISCRVNRPVGFCSTIRELFHQRDRLQSTSTARIMNINCTNHEHQLHKHRMRCPGQPEYRCSNAAAGRFSQTPNPVSTHDCRPVSRKFVGVDFRRLTIRTIRKCCALQKSPGLTHSLLRPLIPSFGGKFGFHLSGNETPATRPLVTSVGAGVRCNALIALRLRRKCVRRRTGRFRQNPEQVWETDGSA